MKWWRNEKQTIENRKKSESIPKPRDKKSDYYEHRVENKEQRARKHETRNRNQKQIETRTHTEAKIQETRNQTIS